MLLSTIPGYTAAVARALAVEDATRQRAFLPFARTIAGAQVCQLTLRHFTLLYAAGSPFLLPARSAFPATLEEALQFLWIVSPAHRSPDRATLAEVKRARAAWLRSVWPRARRAKLGRVCREIRALIDEALFDREKSSGDSSDAPIAFFAAAIIDEFAGAYGWLPDAILDLPLAVLFQLRRCRTQRANPEAVILNRLSNAVGTAIIARFAARAKKAAKRK